MIKKTIKCISVFIILLFSFALSVIFFPFRSRVLQNFVMTYFSKSVNFMFSVEIDYTGKNYGGRNGLIILCNHISYMDIPIILSYFNGRFIVKKEVRKWPVFGWFTFLLGNIFIQRGKKESYYVINDAVRKGDVNIIIFPEGTTSDGSTIRELKDGPFYTAIKNKSSILPLVLKYDNKEVAWVGDASFIPHLWNISNLKKNVSMHVGDIIDSTKFKSLGALKSFTYTKMLELYKK